MEVRSTPDDPQGRAESIDGFTDGLTESEAALLKAAATQMRERTEPGWAEVRTRLLTAIRSTARRSSPVRGSFPMPAGAAAASAGLAAASVGDSLLVSDRVLISLIRVAMGDIPGCVPARIGLQLDDQHLLAADIDIVAAYGTDLGFLTGQTRQMAGAVLEAALGAPALPAAGLPVNVTVIDVLPQAPERRA